MERKYVRAIETTKGNDLLVPPPARVLRSLEEDLERTRRKIRELECAEAKPARTQKTAPKVKTKSAR
jgi:type II secretory pathway component HofQ